MTSPQNISAGGSSGIYDTGTDVNISVPAYVNPTYTNTINHWSWGYKNQEGNNGDKSAFHLADTTFTATQGSTFTMGTDRKTTVPNGFTLRSKFGTSYVTGSWVSYNMGTQITQKASSASFEYDYDPISYTITYTMNGGTNSSANPSSYNVLYGVIFSNPSRTGYQFKNWTIGGTAVTGINAGANASFSSASDLYSKCSARTTGNKTVVANWTANTYTVKYNGNGSTSGSTASSSHTYGTAKALTANGFVKTGYKFLGWSTSSTATTATYTDKQSVSNLTSTNGGTVNLYAVWANDQALVRIKVDGSWKTGKVWYKTGDSWKVVTQLQHKVGGTWNLGEK